MQRVSAVVIVNVTVGVVPMIWCGVSYPLLGGTANRYTLFFGLEWLLLGLVALALLRLREERLTQPSKHSHAN